MFFNTPSKKYAINHKGFSCGRVVWGWTGVGRRQLPPKASARTRAPWPAHGFTGLRLTAGLRPSNDVWLMVWEDSAEIFRANLGRAMLNWGRHNAQCLPVWKQLGACWAQVVPMLSQVGPVLSHLGPRLGLCWAHLGPMLGLRRIGPTVSSLDCQTSLSEATRN